MEKEKITTFAETNFRGKRIPFGIKVDDRRRHMYLIGKTGMGKSETLKHMIYDDIKNGHGLCVIDPHGDLAEEILDYVPSERINDVVYFNPSDFEHPIAFNVLEKVDPNYRHLVASGLVGVFKKIWADSWGPRLEYLLRNTILALLCYPDSTLLGINRMFVDKIYRERVVSKIDDPVVKQFWVDEFAKYTEKFVMEAIAPIQNKVGQFLSTSLIRNIVGQVRSSIDVRKIMDEEKILILNMSKGRIGEDASSLLGAMMITKIQLAAMSRVDIPEEERKDFFLYVDEFQNFATDSFANILSEARKYRLNLILAHQYIEQLGETVASAVFGNVGTMIVFRVGATDAEFLEKEFDPYFLATDIVNLPKFNIYLKLMIDGIASDPFSAATLRPIPKEKQFNFSDKIIRVSRERYTYDKGKVEDKIKSWSASSERIKAKEEEKRKAERPIQYRGFCDNCGVPIELTFEPANDKPIYCKECLKDMQKGNLPKDKVPDHAPRKTNPSLKPQPVKQLPQTNKIIHAKPSDTYKRENKLPEDKDISTKPVRIERKRDNYNRQKDSIPPVKIEYDKGSIKDDFKTKSSVLGPESISKKDIESKLDEKSQPLKMDDSVKTQVPKIIKEKEPDFEKFSREVSESEVKPKNNKSIKEDAPVSKPKADSKSKNDDKKVLKPGDIIKL